MDELEEELKSLLNESKADSISGLPAVPANNLQPSAEPVLSSLPDVPQCPLNIRAEQLEEELNRLTLTDSGLRFHVLFSVQLLCPTFEITYSHFSVQDFNRKNSRRQPRY